jgi:hypothetical protein
MILNAIIFLFVLFILTDSYYLRKVNLNIDENDDLLKTKVNQTEISKKKCYNYSIENFQSNTTEEKNTENKNLRGSVQEPVERPSQGLVQEPFTGPSQGLSEGLSEEPAISSENEEEIIFNYLKPKILFLLDQNLTNNIHISAYNKKYLVSIEKDNLSVLAYITDM